jgi:glutathione S-transferase
MPKQGDDMLTIYGVPLSVHTRKTIVTAMHKSIDYKLEVVIPVVPNNPPANWRTLSPTRLIPVIRDGDYTLADSTAICLYLEKKYPSAPILPADIHHYGRALWFDAYAGGTLFQQVVRPLFHQSVVAPNINKVPIDQSEVDRVLDKIRPEVFGYLESQIGGKFLVGSSLTLADIAVASNFLVYQYCGFPVDADRYPKLTRYLREIIGVDVFQKAIEQEKPFVEQMGLSRGFLK